MIQTASTVIRTASRWRRWALICGAVAPIVAALLLVMALAAMVAGKDGMQTAQAGIPDSVPGIPPELLKAYSQGAQIVSERKPECKGMRWQIIAAVGKTESSSTAGRTISAAGDVSPPVIGPAIGYPDTDGGVLDGLTGEDRAVGPLQFLPQTWKAYQVDANGDGVANPQNIYDAAATAGNYLCGNTPVDLSQDPALRDALFRYNHSASYVDQVLSDVHTFDAIPGATGAGGAPQVNAAGNAKVVIDAATSQIGTTYAWGGGNASGPSKGISDGGGAADQHGDFNKVGFDCSGLTLYAYTQAGITLPRTAAAQYHQGTHIPAASGVAALQPGDLVFFSALGDSGGAGVHHVGIYIGNGQMLNAPQSGTTVRIDAVWQNEYAGASRLL